MAQPELVGTKIGRYQIQSLLHEGGLSKTFLAEDTQLDRHVAIKVPKEDDDDFYIHQEGKVLAALDHPAIQPVYDIGRENDVSFLALGLTEYSLQDELDAARSVANEVIEQTTPSRLRHWIESLAQVAEAIDYCHRRGYIHRCLSPKAIRFTRNGLSCVQNFQLAISHSEMRDEVLDRFAGIPLYMSPEQARRSLPISSSSDIWALGAVLFDVLTGEGLWSGSVVSILTKLASSADPRKPREVRADVPQQLEEICLKCLRPEPADRYQRADELADELRRWTQGRTSAIGQAFISHSSKDRDFVEREIVSLLERNGIRTWYSKVDIQSAKDWERSLREGLKYSDWLVLVMSKHSLDSEWCRDELFWAIDNLKGKIVPVLIDDVDPTAFHIRLSRIQHIDFRNAVLAMSNARQSLVQAFQGK